MNFFSKETMIFIISDLFFVHKMKILKKWQIPLRFILGVVASKKYLSTIEIFTIRSISPVKIGEVYLTLSDPKDEFSYSRVKVVTAK